MPDDTDDPTDDATDEPELVAAARRGDVLRVRELVTSGADVETRAPGGGKALSAAIAAGHLAVARLLRKVGARGAGPALARAAGRGDLEAVRSLLAAGEPPDAAAKDRAGRRFTPLHRAALAGHAEVVRELLSRGAAVDARVGGGPPPWDRTALHLAAATGSSDVVTDLLAARADPASRDLAADGTRRTAAELARGRGHEELACLLERATPSTAPVPQRRTPPGARADTGEPTSRYAVRRGLHLDEGVRAPSLVLVKAEVEATAQALQSSS